MLLPSAFPCVGPLLTPQVVHPSSASTYRSTAVPSKHRRTISSDIYTTCRALQDRLSSNFSHSPLRALCSPTLLPSPAIQATPEKPVVIQPDARPSRPPSARQSALGPESPRSAKKRRRSINDDEDRDSSSESDGNAPSTPKRQCIAPPSIPLGLLSQDFDGLSRTPVADKALCYRSPDILAPVVKPSACTNAPCDTYSTTLSPSSYSSSLVALILEKFSLREEVWKDLEPSSGSMDDRWRSLMTAAEMARGRRIRREMVIRRGGKRERKNLDGLW